MLAICLVKNRYYLRPSTDTGLSALTYSSPQKCRGPAELDRTKADYQWSLYTHGTHFSRLHTARCLTRVCSGKYLSRRYSSYFSKVAQ
jgi:hypothetical protein